MKKVTLHLTDEAYDALARMASQRRRGILISQLISRESEQQPTQDEQSMGLHSKPHRSI